MTLAEVFERLGINIHDNWFPERDVYALTITGPQMHLEVPVDPTPDVNVGTPGIEDEQPADRNPFLEDAIITTPAMRERYRQREETLAALHQPAILNFERLTERDPEVPQGGVSADEARERHGTLAREVEGEGEAAQRTTEYEANGLANLITETEAARARMLELTGTPTVVADPNVPPGQVWHVPATTDRDLLNTTEHEEAHAEFVDRDQLMPILTRDNGIQTVTMEEAHDGLGAANNNWHTVIRGNE